MGPLVTRAQQAAAFDGIRKLASEAEFVIGGAGAARARRHRREQGRLRRADPAAGQGCKRRRRRARGRGVRAGGDHRALQGRDRRLHARSRAAAARWWRRSMARTSDFLARMVSGIGASHGRLLVIDPSIADCPYRPWHRHAAMQSRRPRPRRRRRGARRPLRPALLSPAPGGAGFDRSAREPAGAGGGDALIGGANRKWPNMLHCCARSMSVGPASCR